MTLSRREFLEAALGATVAASACRRAPPPRRFQGRLLGPSHERGHRLREPFARGPVATERIGTAIVGGGMSGLAAAWRLASANDESFVVFELEPQAGGTSAHGDGFPWGAHYVPVPAVEDRALVALLRELDAIERVSDDGEVVCREEVLCRAPQERVFLRDRWYEGLYPRAGATGEDLRQLDDFHDAMLAYARLRDGSGRRAFALPMEQSSADAELVALDRLSMAELMDQRGWTSPRLRWFVEYACRDDYGLKLGQTSAWAAIHYWAARLTREDGRTAELLTWPEGNGRIVDHLARRAGARLRLGAMVTSLVPVDSGVEVHVEDAKGERRAYLADRVIFALPKFLAPRLVAPWRERPPEHLRAFSWGSWVVANVALSGRPRSRGFPLAWDNVLYGSESLGYVVSTHQEGRDHGPTTWTWYLPLCGPDPRGLRDELLAAPWDRWADAVVADLSRAHVDFEQHVQSIDVWRWGHAMIRPVPGFIWGPDRARASEAFGRIHFAGTDLSGVALIEEALHHGVRAAEEVLAARGVTFSSLL